MLRAEQLKHDFDVCCEERHQNLIVLEPKSRVDLTKEIAPHKFSFDAVFNEARALSTNIPWCHFACLTAPLPRWRHVAGRWQREDLCGDPRATARARLRRGACDCIRLRTDWLGQDVYNGWPWPRRRRASQRVGSNPELKLAKPLSCCLRAVLVDRTTATRAVCTSSQPMTRWRGRASRASTSASPSSRSATLPSALPLVTRDMPSSPFPPLVSPPSTSATVATSSPLFCCPRGIRGIHSSSFPPPVTPRGRCTADKSSTSSRSVPASRCSRTVGGASTYPGCARCRSTRRMSYSALSSR